MQNRGTSDMILRPWMLVVVLLVTSAAGADAQPGANKPLDYVGQLAARLEPTRTVVYKEIGDRKLHLHVFEPLGHKPVDRRAAFVTIHGGGWTGLEPRRQFPFAAHFARLGMVGISIEYRLFKPGSGTTVFDCVKDSRSAMRYVKTHAAELGIDPQKIVANGGSAGGHLAAGTALFDGIDEPNEDTSVSCIPCAVVLYFPVIDTSTEGYGNKKIGPRWKEISPLEHVRPGAPPMILFHGTSDKATPFAGAKKFSDAMLKAGNRCELVPAEGCGHGYSYVHQEYYEDTLRKTEAFLVSLGILPNRGKDQDDAQ